MEHDTQKKIDSQYDSRFDNYGYISTKEHRNNIEQKENMNGVKDMMKLMLNSPIML